MTGYVRVTNSSGELYDNAQTRLVVGKINLVEKIADLARRPPPGTKHGSKRRVPKLGRRRGPLPRHMKMARRTLPARSNWMSILTLDEAGKPKQVIKQGLSEYFLFTIEGREDIKDKEPKRLVALKVADVPLESIYKLSDRDRRARQLHQVLPLQERQAARRAGQGEEALGHGEPGPLAAAQRHRQALLRIQEQGPGLRRRHRDQVRAHRRPRGSQRRAGQGHHDPPPAEGPEDRQRRRPAVQTRLDDEFVLYYDLVDYDETFFYEEELVSGKPVPAKIEVERQFDANVVLWGEGEQPKGWTSNEPGPTSICTRSPAAWNGSISSTSSISWT